MTKTSKLCYYYIILYYCTVLVYRYMMMYCSTITNVVGSYYEPLVGSYSIAHVHVHRLGSPIGWAKGGQ